MEAFPTITDLANAEEETVLRLWQGLGYYSRARNLHATAIYVSKELNGQFPSSYSEIIKLKGVGPYTAAAIASICFNEAQPVVDGNVFRFASRYFGIESDISKSGSRKVFENVLTHEIPASCPGTFNQAMMEFGATICSPSPKCDSCGFSTDCYAYASGLQKRLPVKTGKTKVSIRHFSYIVLKFEDSLFMRQRKEKDVWQGLYDFFLIEGDFGEENVLLTASHELGLNNPLIDDISETFIHLLSHQKIHARFYLLSISEEDSKIVVQKTGLNSFSTKEMLNLPKPKLIVNYLEQVGIN